MFVRVRLTPEAPFIPQTPADAAARPKLKNLIEPQAKLRLGVLFRSVTSIVHSR